MRTIALLLAKALEPFVDGDGAPLLIVIGLRVGLAGGSPMVAPPPPAAPPGAASALAWPVLLAEVAAALFPSALPGLPLSWRPRAAAPASVAARKS